MLIVNSVGIVPEHLLRRALRFKNLAVADVLAETGGYGLTALILASQGFGVWSLVWGAIMRRVVHVAIVLIHSPLSLNLRFGLPEAKELLAYGSGLSFAGVFNFVAQRGSYFVIGRWLGAAPLGHYTQANRLISVPFESVSLTLLNLMFPAMSARQKQIDRLQAVYLYGIEMLSLLVVPVSVAVFVSAPEMVAVILGKQWGSVVPIVQVLALALPFRAGGALNVPSIRALGGVYREAWRQAFWALLVIVGCYFGSRRGLVGVAVAIVAAWIVVQFLMTHLALSLLDLDWPRFLRCYLPALWVGVWAGVTVCAVSELLRVLALPSFFALSLELTVWFASVLAALYFAPSFARPTFSVWIVRHMNFDELGRPGRSLQNALAKLLRVIPQPLA